MDSSDHECIDPEIGGQAWRIDDPDLGADLGPRLALHIRHCAACRQRVAFMRAVAEGLQAGQLALRPAATRRPAWTTWSLGLGGAAMAACLTLLAVLPPRLPAEAVVLRGEGVPAISAPLASAVIRDRTPVIRWTKLDAATRYRVTVREVDGDYRWAGETTVAEIALPDSAELPISARLRVVVEPIPGHLVPDGALRSSFRTGTWTEFASFRLRAAPLAVLFGAVVGALCLAAGTVGRRWIRA